MRTDGLKKKLFLTADCEKCYILCCHDVCAVPVSSREIWSLSGRTYMRHTRVVWQ